MFTQLWGKCKQQESIKLTNKGQLLMKKGQNQESRELGLFPNLFLNAALKFDRLL